MVTSCHRAGGQRSVSALPGDTTAYLFLLLLAPFSFWARKTAAQALPGPPRLGGALLSASLGSASSQGSIGAQNKPRPIVGVEKAMAPHSSTLAWKIPWMEEPGGLQTMGSLRVGHD